MPARVGLAHHAVGALVMRYTACHGDAEELGYDIDLLAARYVARPGCVRAGRPHRRRVQAPIGRRERNRRRAHNR